MLIGVEEHRVKIFGAPKGRSYLFPFSVLTLLLFILTFIQSLLSIQNGQFINLLNISASDIILLQSSVYIGYFIIAFPVGLINKKYGYKIGILAGLLLYTLGCILFYRATLLAPEFILQGFLLAFFVFTCSLAFLETSTYPFVALLGQREAAERRLNLAYSFNTGGWILGPLFGTSLLFSGKVIKGKELLSLSSPYLSFGFIILAVTFVFFITKMPKVNEEKMNSYGIRYSSRPLTMHKNFTKALFAQFFCMAAQVGIFTFFITYSIDIYRNLFANIGTGTDMVLDLVNLVQNNVSDKCAADLDCVFTKLGGYTMGFLALGFFWFGRFSSFFYLLVVRPDKILRLFSIINMCLLFITMTAPGIISVIALSLSFYFVAVMFPIIFGLGIKGLGIKTRQASSYLIMSTVGGAFSPLLMEWISDTYSMRLSFIVPLLCFIPILYYGIDGFKINPDEYILKFNLGSFLKKKLSA